LRLKGLLFILVEMLRGSDPAEVWRGERPSHRPEAVSLREHDMLIWSSYFVKTLSFQLRNIDFVGLNT
jgi:hypothetical protein